MDEGFDYKYLYAQSWDSDKVATSVQFLNEKRLMQSTDCITEATFPRGACQNPGMRLFYTLKAEVNTARRS